MKTTFKLFGILLSIVCLLSLTGCDKLFNSKELNFEISGSEDAMKISREDSGPSQGGTLNLFMYRFNTLNPLTTKNKTVQHLSYFVFDSLFKQDEDRLISSLAKSFSASQENAIYDIVINDGVYFHDGQQLTAEDVVFTINAIRDAGSKSIFGKNISNIANVKAIDRLSFRIILENPDSDLISKLTFPIVPKHVFEDWPIEGHSEDLKLVGSGPFVFDSYDDNQIILSRNDSWWVTDTGIINHPIWIDNIIFKIYPNESDRMAAFQKKEIDIAWIEEGDMEAYSKRADIFYSEFENNLIEFMALSPTGTKNSPMSQADFRKALIEYLCWYSEMDTINSDEVKLNATCSFYSNQKKTDRITTINALQEAGYTYDEEENILFTNKSSGKTQITLSLMYNSINEERFLFGEWINKALLEIGIKVVCQSATYEELQQTVLTGDFDIVLLGCRIPISSDIKDVPELIKESLEMTGQSDVILPLYRKKGAVLYHNYIRGERRPVWQNIYNGWIDWYLVKPASE
ncbi:MAG: ABC transporter substrate-binding protein [Clostridiaceae bacterium]|nr:ABC transporter substrate-binding protein [Clostridiaceae bacterium]